LDDEPELSSHDPEPLLSDPGPLLSEPAPLSAEAGPEFGDTDGEADGDGVGVGSNVGSSVGVLDGVGVGVGVGSNDSSTDGVGEGESEGLTTAEGADVAETASVRAHPPITYPPRTSVVASASPVTAHRTKRSIRAMVSKAQPSTVSVPVIPAASWNLHTMS
jgi:hypothetical protein